MKNRMKNIMKNIMKKNIFIMATSIALIGSASASSVIVDFTAAGVSNNANGDGFVFSSQDVSLVSTGVSFDITVSAVIPAGGGANGGNVTRNNGGVGSTVENTGGFINTENNVSEVLRFTIDNVAGLQAGETLQVANLLSQNSGSTAADQTGGFGGTFGHSGSDSVTITLAGGDSFVINESDAGDLGSSLLLADNNTATTGNTFAHGAGNLDVLDPTNGNFFDLALTDLAANEAVLIQGFEFAVVPIPEPSSTALLGLGGLAMILRRRK